MGSGAVLMVFFIILLSLILAFFALSSCLGDDFRTWLTGRDRNAPATTFGLQYARLMSHGASQGGWEQIEMEDMLNKTSDHEE